MSPTHVVVDGSNLATEGRSLPSLAQLDDAVRQFQDEFPDAETIIVVDATFGHRIDPSERAAFDEAVAHGELVSPPAGAIGRGDAFVLRIAERVGAQVLSNDSFQEFHAEHPWLFDEGRLIGGKPVGGIGWIFTPRLPVRGPRSRAVSGSRGSGRRGVQAAAATPEAQPARRRRGRSAALLEAVEAAAAEATEAATAPLPEGPDRTVTVAQAKPNRSRRRRRGRKSGDPAVVAAIEAATQEAVGAEEETPTRRARSRPDSAPQAVNDPLSFIQFISTHPIGARVEGTVSNFVSHGAMVDVGDFCCYVPLSGLGSPPPKSARSVLPKGETHTFVVAALDPPRRGVQLALPEIFTGTDAAPSADAPAAVASPTEAPGKKATKPAKVTTAPKEAAKARKAATPRSEARATKAAKAERPAKAAKTTTSTKAGRTAKAAPASKASAPRARVSPAKVANVAAKPAKAVKAATPARTTPASKGAATKATKAAKATKATKATKADKAAKAEKTAKATKAAKDGKATPSRRPSAGPRGSTGGRGR